MTLPTSISATPNVRIAHDEIHSGSFFSTHTISTGLMIASPKRFLFISPSESPVVITDSIEVHLIFIITTNPGIKIEFFENTSVSDNGTALTIINQNRNSTIQPLGQVFENPTVISEGTLIFSQIVGTATTGGTGGLLRRDEQEIILKIQTNYLLKITPLADNTDITTHFKGYDARPSAPVPIPGNTLS